MNDWIVELQPVPVTVKSFMYRMITAEKGPSFWDDWTPQKRTAWQGKGRLDDTETRMAEEIPPSSFEDAIERAALITHSEFMRVRVRNIVTGEIVPGDILCHD